MGDSKRVTDAIYGQCEKCLHQCYDGHKVAHYESEYDSGDWLELECRRCGYKFSIEPADYEEEEDGV